MMSTDTKMLTVSEVAEFLRTTEKTVRRYLNNGEIEGSKLNRTWRIHPDDLKKFLEERKNTNGKN